MLSVYVILAVGLVGMGILWLLLRSQQGKVHLMTRREFTALSLGLWVNGKVWMRGVDINDRWFWMSRAQNRELQDRLGEQAKWDAIAEEAIEYRSRQSRLREERKRKA